MSVWCTWSLKQAAPGKSVLIDSVFERLQYFYIATIVLNLVCTGKPLESIQCQTLLILSEI